MPLQLNPRMTMKEPMQRCKLHECRAACCLYGVWLDSLEVEDILEHVELITPNMPPSQRDPLEWLDGRQEDDEFSTSGKVAHSAVLVSEWHYGGTVCVFLRDDYKCALQVAGEKAGMHPWRFKPFYCILHPLDLDDEGRITLDETAQLLDEPASCLRHCDKNVSLLKTFEPELRYFLGDERYQDLCNPDEITPP